MRRWMWLMLVWGAVVLTAADISVTYAQGHRVVGDDISGLAAITFVAMASKWLWTRRRSAASPRSPARQMTTVSPTDSSSEKAA